MFNRSNSESGNIAIVAALSMAVLLTMAAFVIDAGYLYGEKNKYQNGVEAAAMAGAVSLCDADPEGVAKQAAINNGLPADSITVQVGFYDEKDLYGDFPEYRDFVVEGENGYPEDEFNNAVMVKLDKDVDTLMGGFVGKNEVTVGAAAVAYLVRYGMLALGEEEGDGIEVNNTFHPGEPVFKNGDIHANGDIFFHNNAPDIDVDTVTVTAHGTVTGYDSGISGANILELPPVDVYLDKLYAKADRILSESDFTSTSWDEPPEEDGNYYVRTGSRYMFGPHPGDHGGAIYYFEFTNSNSRLEPANRFEDNDRITNLVIATNRSVRFRPSNHSALHLWGGDGHTVMIIAKGDIDLGKSAFFYSDSYCNFEGAVFWAGNDIYYRTGSGHDFHGSSPGTRWLRMVADGKISIPGRTTGGNRLQFDFLFAPPCPPNIVKLGRLKKAE